MDANSNPESVMRERQQTFKTTNAQARSHRGEPVWKERFRERCRKRVSVQRGRLRERLRSNPDDLKPLQSFAKDVFRSELENSHRLGLMTPPASPFSTSTMQIPHESLSRDDTEMKSESGDSVSEIPSPKDPRKSFTPSPNPSPFSLSSSSAVRDSTSSSSFSPFNPIPSSKPSFSPFSSSSFSYSHPQSASASEFDMRDTESGDQFRFSALSSGDDHNGFHGECTKRLCGDAENGIFVSDFDEKEILYMIEEELRMQIIESEPDGALLQAFEAYEDALLQNEIDDYVASERVSTDEKVLCPLCGRLYLDQHGRFIICTCGFKLDMEADGLTLSNLRDRLASCMECHGSNCPERPKFQMLNRFGITTLMVTCDVCGCSEIVL